MGRPITGFSCWGMGFVDLERRLAGCLLHPARNREDLRSHTGYREKCERETCPQHLTFVNLDEPVRRTLLKFASGLDSFQFSSPRSNPLWNLLLWGGNVLTEIHVHLVPDSPLYRYLTSHPTPGSRAYLLSGLLRRLSFSGNVARVTDPDFEARFENAADRIYRESEALYSAPEAGDPFVHRMDLDQSLAQFIRLGLKRPKMKREIARRVARKIESALERLSRDLIQG